MDALAILQSLKEKSGCFELYHVAEYEGYREKRNGGNQHVTIRILDSGREERDTRYHVLAVSDDGERATGNPADSLDVALAIVHWNDLDG